MLLIRREQPTNESCGQTCVAMLTGKTPNEIGRLVGHMRVTFPEQIRRLLHTFNVKMGENEVSISNDFAFTYPLPRLCLVRVGWIKRNSSSKIKKTGHFLIHFEGIFYNPGSQSDSPVSKNLPPNSRITHVYPIQTPEPMVSAIANPEALSEAPRPVAEAFKGYQNIHPVIRKSLDKAAGV